MLRETSNSRLLGARRSAFSLASLLVTHYCSGTQVAPADPGTSADKKNNFDPARLRIVKSKTDSKGRFKIFHLRMVDGNGRDMDGDVGTKENNILDPAHPNQGPVDLRTSNGKFRDYPDGDIRDVVGFTGARPVGDRDIITLQTGASYITATSSQYPLFLGTKVARKRCNGKSRHGSNAMKISKKMVRIIFVALTLNMAIVESSFADGQDSGSTKTEAGKLALDYMGRVLKRADMGGRIYYSAGCVETIGGSAHFPSIDLRPLPENSPALTAIAHLFSGDAGVNVRNISEKVIGVSIGTVPSTLLQTKISHLHLAQYEQYDANLAIDAIENAPEVKSAMKKNNIDFPVQIFSNELNAPAPSKPHLPEFLNGVTVDQALNMVAEKLKGIVIFNACVHSNGGSLIVIDFEEN